MILHVEVLAESLHRPNKSHLLLFLIIKKKQESWCQQISLGRVSGARVLGTRLILTAPETYCVSHECPLQNLPKHLIHMTPKGIQVVPARKEGRGSWIPEGERFSAACRGRQEVLCGDPVASEQCLLQDDGWSSNTNLRPRNPGPTAL